jgi:hypothetical protein
LKFLVAIGGVIQFVGVAIVLLDVHNDREQAKQVLAGGRIREDLSIDFKGALPIETRQAIADLVHLREWLSEQLESGLGRKKWGALLVMLGLVVSTVGACA